MQEDKASLIQTILDHPDEDGPRLIYADWLDEHDKPEPAEFIRVQCRINVIQPEIRSKLFGKMIDLDPIVTERAKLRLRASELLDGHAWGWAGKALRDAAPLGIHWQKFMEWRRGFVEVITCTAECWLTHADALTAAQPIKEVALTTWPTFEHQIVWGGHQQCFTGRAWWFTDQLKGTIKPNGLPIIVQQLLKAAWPKIKFDLSRAGRTPDEVIQSIVSSVVTGRRRRG